MSYDLLEYFSTGIERVLLNRYVAAEAEKQSKQKSSDTGPQRGEAVVVTTATSAVEDEKTKLARMREKILDEKFTLLKTEINQLQCEIQLSMHVLVAQEPAAKLVVPGPVGSSTRSRDTVLKRDL